MDDNNEKSLGWCLIPPLIMARNDMPMSHKLLFGRILGLTNSKGYCYASNAWLGEQISMHSKSVGRVIAKLQKLNLVRVEIERDEKKQIIQRKIYTLSTGGLIPINLQVDTPINLAVDRVYNTVSVEKSTHKTTASGKAVCPLEGKTGNHQDLKAKYPNGHKECIQFIDSVADIKGHKFTNYQKQIGALHKMLRASRDFEDIASAAQKIMKSPFYLEKGWDLATIAAELDRG